MKRLFTILFCALTATTVCAAGFPTLSDGTNEFWYYLKFTQGNFVVASNGDGSVCKSAIPTGKSSQLWKVEGSASVGYTLTNKLGMMLYVSGLNQGDEVRAKAEAPSLYRFKIRPSGTNYTISPYDNTEQSFNVWGGMAFRSDIKLYKSNDANAPIEFVAEDALTMSNIKVNVIPYPSSVSIRGGQLDLHDLTAITCFSDSTELLARRLATDLERTAGITVPVVNTTSNTAPEGLSLSLSQASNRTSEAYRLNIVADGIDIEASDYGGFFNALQTLRQLMPAAIFGQTLQPDEAWSVPLLLINDAPVMPHRGFHLDVSRHFFDKEEVKKLLDMASVYKLNRFHWHLTDDQGWRVEIPEYPLLTTVGAVRKASLTVYDPTNGLRFYDDTEYGHGCFYTLDDLREVVAYARERNIEIIPEIDMPGHMTACIVAYPELGCDPTKKIEVMTEGGVSRDILNLGKEETIDFLKCVLGHVAEVFPYELIHLGGDECPTNAWQSNADCQKLIQQEGLNGVNDLQPWLVEQLGSFLRDKYGKTVVVWDELLANWKNAYTVKPVVMSWRGVEYAKQAADRGLQSIVVPTRPLYLDQLQISPSQMEIDSPYMGGYGDGTINSVESIYNFNPRSTVSGREQYVLGTQANLWTESCTSNREAEYQYYPRLMAVSEIGWLADAKKDFGGFYYRLQQHEPVLQAKEICYAPHYFEPEELMPDQQLIAEVESVLSQSTPGAVGYPSQAAYDVLQQALNDFRSTINGSPVAAEPTLSPHDALFFQLLEYKNAPICLPKADRYYQVVSASTFFRNRFDGSTLYVKGSDLNIHYTPQTEPEELWQFAPQDDGTFQMFSVNTGKGVTITAADNGAVKANKTDGTKLSIRKATKPAGGYTYIPGVVNIKNGRYNLYAKLSGSTLTIVASTDSTLCYPGTWRIVEVTDYSQWLQKLVDKLEHILATANTHEVGQPTEAALHFLADEVIAPAHQKLEAGPISRQDFLDVQARYEQFLGMGTVTIDDILDEGHYYLIRNAYFNTHYASVNSTGKNVVPKALTDADSFRWAISKNANGTVSIRNKQTGTQVYVTSSKEEQRVQLGSDYQWTLRQVTTDQGNTAIAITDLSGTYSWYANPSAWGYVLLKPYEWGASVWDFVLTDEEVADGIRPLYVSPADATLYDLAGRRLMKKPARGIYIQGGHKVVVR